MKIGEAIETVLETLPYSFDVTEDGKYVADDTEYGEEGYFLNAECTIELAVYGKNTIAIKYYCEDDYYIEITDEDGDGEINVEPLTKDELRYKVISMFSNDIGWIEKFESWKFEVK